MKLSIDKIIDLRLNMQSTQRKLMLDFRIDAANLNELFELKNLRKIESFDQKQLNNLAYILGGPTNKQRTISFIEKFINNKSKELIKHEDPI